MKFEQQMWHPNIYVDGRVCISILHPPGSDAFNEQEPSDERWRPVLSVESIIVSVISLLTEPNVESPANVDAAVEYKNDPQGYKRRVQLLARQTSLVYGGCVACLATAREGGRAALVAAVLELAVALLARRPAAHAVALPEHGRRGRHLEGDVAQRAAQRPGAREQLVDDAAGAALLLEVHVAVVGHARVALLAVRLGADGGKANVHGRVAELREEAAEDLGDLGLVEGDHVGDALHEQNLVLVEGAGGLGERALEGAVGEAGVGGGGLGLESALGAVELDVAGAARGEQPNGLEAGKGGKDGAYGGLVNVPPDFGDPQSHVVVAREEELDATEALGVERAGVVAVVDGALGDAGEKGVRDGGHRGLRKHGEAAQGGGGGAGGAGEALEVGRAVGRGDAAGQHCELAAELRYERLRRRRRHGDAGGHGGCDGGLGALAAVPGGASDELVLADAELGRGHGHRGRLRAHAATALDEAVGAAAAVGGGLRVGLRLATATVVAAQNYVVEAQSGASAARLGAVSLVGDGHVGALDVLDVAAGLGVVDVGLGEVADGGELERGVKEPHYEAVGAAGRVLGGNLGAHNGADGRDEGGDARGVALAAGLEAAHALNHKQPALRLGDEPLQQLLYDLQVVLEGARLGGQQPELLPAPVGEQAVGALGVAGEVAHLGEQVLLAQQDAAEDLDGLGVVAPEAVGGGDVEADEGAGVGHGGHGGVEDADELLGAGGGDADHRLEVVYPDVDGARHVAAGALADPEGELVVQPQRVAGEAHPEVVALVPEVVQRAHVHDGDAVGVAALELEAQVVVPQAVHLAGVQHLVELRLHLELEALAALPRVVALLVDRLALGQGPAVLLGQLRLPHAVLVEHVGEPGEGEGELAEEEGAHALQLRAVVAAGAAFEQLLLELAVLAPEQGAVQRVEAHRLEAALEEAAQPRQVARGVGSAALEAHVRHPQLGRRLVVDGALVHGDEVIVAAVAALVLDPGEPEAVLDHAVLHALPAEELQVPVVLQPGGDVDAPGVGGQVPGVGLDAGGQLLEVLDAHGVLPLQRAAAVSAEHRGIPQRERDGSVSGAGLHTAACRRRRKTLGGRGGARVSLELKAAGGNVAPKSPDEGGLVGVLLQLVVVGEVLLHDFARLAVNDGDLAVLQQLQRAHALELLDGYDVGVGGQRVHLHELLPDLENVLDCAQGHADELGVGRGEDGADVAEAAAGGEVLRLLVVAAGGGVADGPAGLALDVEVVAGHELQQLLHRVRLEEGLHLVPRAGGDVGQRPARLLLNGLLVGKQQLVQHGDAAAVDDGLGLAVVAGRDVAHRAQGGGLDHGLGVVEELDQAGHGAGVQHGLDVLFVAVGDVREGPAGVAALGRVACDVAEGPDGLLAHLLLRGLEQRDQLRHRAVVGGHLGLLLVAGGDVGDGPGGLELELRCVEAAQELDEHGHHARVHHLLDGGVDLEREELSEVLRAHELRLEVGRADSGHVGRQRRGRPVGRVHQLAVAFLAAVGEGHRALGVQARVHLWLHGRFIFACCRAAVSLEVAVPRLLADLGLQVLPLAARVVEDLLVLFPALFFAKHLGLARETRACANLDCRTGWADGARVQTALESGGCVNRCIDKSMLPGGAFGKWKSAQDGSSKAAYGEACSVESRGHAREA
ncbi:ubiquitin-conjugating enzyme e2, putative [Babesia caballi]|uniref:Ubiquitin-conjugating enzyme e2, putative n=1 Tax=Babesia caballi TaxID=5871 RepID=A0AAV4LKZ5_BABCB|nr:ubiquitin-conjugating enzyme e2, putative [Babesia caballi]